MDHDHTEAEVGEVDGGDNAEVHDEHGEPGVFAGGGMEDEGEEEDFEGEDGPGHDLKKLIGEGDHEITCDAGTGEGIVHEVGEGGAIEPAGAGELEDAGEGVTGCEEYPGGDADHVWHFPIWRGCFIEGQFFSERDEGSEEEEESDIGEAGVDDEGVGGEEAGEGEPEKEGAGAAGATEGECDGGGGGEDQPGGDEGGGGGMEKGVGPGAGEGAVAVAKDALMAEEFDAVGDEGGEVPAEVEAEKDAKYSELL